MATLSAKEILGLVLILLLVPWISLGLWIYLSPAKGKELDYKISILGISLAIGLRSRGVAQVEIVDPKTSTTNESERR